MREIDTTHTAKLIPSDAKSLLGAAVTVVSHVVLGTTYCSDSYVGAEEKDRRKI